MKYFDCIDPLCSLRGFHHVHSLPLDASEVLNLITMADELRTIVEIEGYGPAEYYARKVERKALELRSLWSYYWSR